MRMRLKVITTTVLLLASCSAFSQGPVPVGQIQGTIVSQGNQGVAKATVSVLSQGTTPGNSFQANTLTGSDGSFSFSGVPIGTYTICVQVPGLDYLDPCTWSDNPPTVSLNAKQGGSAEKIRLEEGQILKVKLNDSNKLLQADEGKVKGAQVLIGVWTANGLFVPMRIRTKSATSRNLEVPIPNGKPLQISVSSGYFDLTDESNSKLDAKGVTLPVQASPNAALHVYTFNVAGRKARP